MEGIRGIQHPLQTPIILECIFKNLELDDLQICREVCRTWRNESGKAMRALAAVRILCDQPDTRGPSKFLELVTSDESTFFEAPFAEVFIVMNGNAGIPNFWETCGAYIKALRLHDVTFSLADTFRQAIFQLCPNLKELKIVHVAVCGESAPKPEEWLPPRFTPNQNLKTLSFFCITNEFSIGWLEIFSQFPCLEKLVVSEMGDKIGNIFRALEVARQHDTNCWKLKEVKLQGGSIMISPLPPSFVRLFGEGDLTLTSLSMKGMAVDTVEEVIKVQKILVANANTLKEVAISQHSDDLQETYIFPLPGNQVLENVLELELYQVNMKSTRFLQTFPNVKKLVVDMDMIPEDPQTPHVTLNDCTQLMLYNRIDEIDDFKRLFGLLPNLRKLKINCVINEEFTLICENWPDLRHLDLSECYGLDDACISGFDEKDARKINRRGRRSSWRPITVRRANLSSLKCLESFSWRLSPEESSKVGYCTEAYGILELPELKHLNVRREVGVRNGFRKVFKTMFKSLSDQFPWNESQGTGFD